MLENGSLSDPTMPLDVAIPIQFLPGNNDNFTVQDTENIAVYLKTMLPSDYRMQMTLS
jgi:hypothetical protein